MRTASQTGQKWQQSRDIMVKILAAIYVGGAYGLILVSLAQAAILFSWLSQ